MRFGPALPKVATALHVHACSILTMSFFGIGASGTAMSHLNPKTVHPAVPHRVPIQLGGGPMGRALTSCPLLRQGIAVLQLGNGLCQIGNNFFSVAGKLQPACQ